MVPASFLVLIICWCHRSNGTSKSLVPIICWNYRASSPLDSVLTLLILHCSFLCRRHRVYPSSLTYLLSRTVISSSPQTYDIKPQKRSSTTPMESTACHVHTLKGSKHGHS